MGWFSWSAVNDPELEHELDIVRFHEGAHILGCEEYGFPYSNVTVNVGRSFFGGIRSEGHITPGKVQLKSERDHVQYAAMGYAGAEGEAMFYMENGMRRGKARSLAYDNAQGDMRIVENNLNGDRRAMRDAQRAAERLIESRWRALIKIARSL